jgi:starch synthase
MKILFAASEVTPFAKTGGLADVAGSLPVALKRLGHDVRVIMPFYRSVESGGSGVSKGRTSVEVTGACVGQKGYLRIGDMEGVPVYFIENGEYFSREALYGTAATDYPDNPERFAFFCRATLAFIKKLDFRPEIIHCNDWQTALIPLLLRHELKSDPFYRRAATVFTIHNLAYQGLFPRESLQKMGLDGTYFTIDQLEYYGKVNLMKGGILNADVISTVSPGYCREIQTPEQGCGLEGVLRQRTRDLHGIINGIDTVRWNPETDRNLARNYSASDPSGKKANKRELQKQLGLERRDVPLLGMVSRMVSQKGFDLIEELLPRFEAADLDLVILGSGDEKYLRSLTAAGERCGHIAVCSGFYNDPLAHRIYAGSDLFLMPSRYEPCGLSQLIALRYGSVPIVRKTGGLADTMKDAASRSGTGFVFQEYSAEALWGAIQRALALHAAPEQWKRVVRRGMNTDVSWNGSALQYEELYLTAVARRRIEQV